MRSKQSNASGNSHYHLKMKSKQTKALKLPEKFEDCQEEWGSDEEEDKLTTPISVPSHYKKYEVEERKIVVQKLDREKVVAGVSYDGQEEAKKIDLAQPGEEAKPAYISADLTAEEEERLMAFLKEYRDVFAWSYKDLKGVDPKVCQHTIPMRDDAKPSIQRPYSYNENFAKKINEEID